MQRILRDDEHTLVDLQQPARRQELIHRYCPPSIGNLFAVARLGHTGKLEWWSELPGQPRRLNELTTAEQKTLQHQLDQRLTALGNLIAELERRGDPAAAELRELPTSATPETLYSVGGEPLLIRWIPPKPVEPPVAGPAASTPPAAPSVGSRKRWLIPIALPLLLALALLGLWLLFQHWDRFSLASPPSQESVEPPVSRDIDTSSRSAEPLLGTGDIQVTLRWESGDDLDLAVTDPNGDTAYFRNPTTPSGGELDVDSNAGCTSRHRNPVENIFWDTGNSLEGTYMATVTLYSRCGGGRRPIPFELTINVNDNIERQTGTFNNTSPRQSFEFSFPQESQER